MVSVSTGKSNIITMHGLQIDPSSGERESEDDLEVILVTRCWRAMAKDASQVLRFEETRVHMSAAMLRDVLRSFFHGGTVKE